MGAKLPDVQTLIQAGFDPKTGLPIKAGSPKGFPKPFLTSDIKRAIRIVDEQDCVNRYVWYNLPSGLDGQLLERILYYKGQAMFFQMGEEFFFLPYALDGSIDVYGRFTGVTPLPFNGKAETKKDAWIPDLIRVPVYDVIEEDGSDPETLCVLLHDYGKQMSETIISRSIINEPILDVISEALPLARTALIASSGVKGMRVPDQDSESNVKAASRSVTRAALDGEPWIPIVGAMEFQDLTSGTQLRSEEYLLYMQSLDNFRLSLIGVENGGLFQKKQQKLMAEQEMNESNTGLVYQDGLTIRQKFCDMVNSIWDLGVWCGPSESVVGNDSDMDGDLTDDQDQSGVPGEQPQGGPSDE